MKCKLKKCKLKNQEKSQSWSEKIAKASCFYTTGWLLLAQAVWEVRCSDARDYSDTSTLPIVYLIGCSTRMHSSTLIQSTQTWKTKPINSARGGATGAGIISKDGFVVQDFFTGPFEQVLKLKMGAHMWNQFGSHFYARGPILSFSSRGFGSKGHVHNFLDIEVLAKGIILYDAINMNYINVRILITKCNNP